MEKQEQIYSGKAKTLYKTNHHDFLIMHFRDDTSAFNGVKLSKLTDKGYVNNRFNAFIMTALEKEGVPTQFEKLLNETETLVKNLSMIPVECVVRNAAAGSLCKRLGIEKGKLFSPPLVEFFFKSDALNDPLITEDHITIFGWATKEELQEMKRLSLKVNSILKALFEKAGILLVDFKLEFGRFHGKVVLGDEFTPDGCRLWDIKTQDILDKDRFRQDLGGVVEAYKEAALRIGVEF